MAACRTETLRLLDCLPGSALCQLLHPEFSPLGWHFGHIAYTEDLWLLPPEQRAQFNSPTFCRLFRADSFPKAERCQLPDRQGLIDYLDTVRVAVEHRLQSEPTSLDFRLWWWLVQHESQHGETIAFLAQLAGITVGKDSLQKKVSHTEKTVLPSSDSMIRIPAGGFWQGNNSIVAQDNERPAHWQAVNAFWLDQSPVTWGEYHGFMVAGGYQQAKFWTKPGWQWRQEQQIEAPLYWSPERLQALNDHPVYGVSAYEAEAYAQFVEKRLPTETEWERAACWSMTEDIPESFNTGEPVTLSQANLNAHWGQTTPVDYYAQDEQREKPLDLIGNVWEWTASVFAPYPGFSAYPYPGYSQAYFDDCHRVLRFIA